MVLFVKLLRSFAYLLGVTGSLIVLNARDSFWHTMGWIIVCAMVPLFVTVQVLSAVHNARNRPWRHRRR